MTEQPFTQHQLFHQKRSTLEEQIAAYYQETRNSSITIQLLLAMKIRHLLGDNNFQLFQKDLVAYLFSQTKINRALRRYFFYFKEYFQEEEWEILTARCFPPKHITTQSLEVIQATQNGTKAAALESS